MQIFVIEHLETDLFDWCKLEYQHISSFVGKDDLMFTNTDNDFLKPLGKVEKKSVQDLDLKNACILDPEAKEEFTPEVAKKFDFIIFGGILGDHPPRTRTKDELSSKLSYPTFNIGKEQMSTDTAVIVTKMICDGKKLSDMEFREGIEVETGEGESVQLPYKYLIVDGKPMLPPGLVDMLKNQEGF